MKPNAAKPAPAQLTSAERTALEKRLRERQQALRAEIRAHLGGGTDTGIVGLSSVPTETDDWGVGDELAARDIAEARQQLAALADVEGALGRMAAGSYGECIDCGEPIATARLGPTPQRPAASTARVLSRSARRGRR